jgi:hypothetical protein
MVNDFNLIEFCHENRTFSLVIMNNDLARFFQRKNARLVGADGFRKRALACSLWAGENEKLSRHSISLREELPLVRGLGHCQITVAKSSGDHSGLLADGAARRRTIRNLSRMVRPRGLGRSAATGLADHAG